MLLRSWTAAKTRPRGVREVNLLALAFRPKGLSRRIAFNRSRSAPLSSGNSLSGFSRRKTEIMSSLSGDTFFLDEFASRQFEGAHAAQLDVSEGDFVQRIHEYYKQGRKLVDGYAPFCKHIFVPNFTSATVNALPITKENEGLLKTGYSRRRPDEVDVLTRWFPRDKVDVPTAEFLDVILYSREQLSKEYFDQPSGGSEKVLPDAPWGIISIKPQNEDYETPMQPITVMRNSLGRSEGGSGVPLDKKAYQASVDYWKAHATIGGDTPAGE